MLQLHPLPRRGIRATSRLEAVAEHTAHYRSRSYSYRVFEQVFIKDQHSRRRTAEGSCRERLHHTSCVQCSLLRHRTRLRTGTCMYVLSRHLGDAAKAAEGVFSRLGVSDRYNRPTTFRRGRTTTTTTSNRYPPSRAETRSSCGNNTCSWRCREPNLAGKGERHQEAHEIIVVCRHRCEFRALVQAQR